MSQETINTERIEKSTQPSTASSQETVSLRPQSSFFSPQISLRPSYGPGNKNASSRTTSASTSAASSTSSSMSSGSESTKSSTYQKPRNTPSSSSSWEKTEDNAPSQSGVTDPSKFQYDRTFMLRFQSLSDMPDSLGMVFVDWPELQRGKGSDEDGKKGQVKKRSGSTSGSKSSPGLQRRASNAYTPRPSFLKDEKDSLLRNIQGTLNKITPENFERLSSSLTQMFGEIADEATYSDAVALVFDKALSEPNFSRMYAELCVELNKIPPKWLPPSDDKKPTFYFRRVLLNKCQEEFEKQTKEIPLPEDPEERAIAKDKRKRRKLGNVKFIGELFKHKSVSEKIIIECFSGLFNDITRYKKEGDKEMLESASELLCKLLATTGKLLESKAKHQLDVYFSEIKKMETDEAFSSRIRFFYQEMMALRANDWKPRREENVPKTITQIHAEALAKEFEEEVQAMVVTKPTVTRSSPSAPPKQTAPQQGQLKITVVKPTKQAQPAAQKQAAPEKSTLSLETLEQKLTDIVEEYLVSLDAKNAVSSLTDIRSPVAFSKFVEIGILNVLDKREKDREALAKLFAALSQHGLLNSEHMTNGLSPVVELVDDLEIDIPGCSKFVGKFVGQAVSANILPASFVDNLTKPSIKTTAQQFINSGTQ